MKFMFDWGSGNCLWSTNQESGDQYGYAVDCRRLPVSRELIDVLEELISRHDEAMNWDEPQGPLRWNPQQCARFAEEARDAWKRLTEELGTNYRVDFVPYQVEKNTGAETKP